MTDYSNGTWNGLPGSGIGDIAAVVCKQAKIDNPKNSKPKAKLGKRLYIFLI